MADGLGAGEALVHGLDVEAVCLFLDVVDGDDVGADDLVLLEVVELLAQGVDGKGCLMGEPHHLDDGGVDDVDVVHVHALEDFLELVDEVVELICHDHDVLTLERGEELGDEVLGNLVAVGVGALLYLVQLLVALDGMGDVGLAALGGDGGVLLHVGEKGLGILDCAAADLHEVVEVVELGLAGHG